MKIEIKILNKEFYGDEDKLPFYTTTGSAAMDLICTEDVVIFPGQVKKIPTGLAIWTGSAFNGHSHMVGLITPRSGLGTKGLVLANTTGLIDEDYQGELIVQAWNRLEPHRFIQRSGHTLGVIDNIGNVIYLEAGDRFAQLMFVPIIKGEWDIVEEFSETTKRGEGGFGHTGK